MPAFNLGLEQLMAEVVSGQQGKWEYLGLIVGECKRNWDVIVKVYCIM